MTETGSLTFFCGKMGAGKSTMAARMAEEEGAVLLSEDTWLAALYPGEIATFDDYLDRAARLRPMIRALVLQTLRAGTDVVMDFPANTRKQRAWFLALATEAGAPHRMIYLEASDDLCLERIAQRAKEQPDRAKFDTPEVFRRVTNYFEYPSEQEGLNTLRNAD
ncbi:MAG: cell division protein ZipA [Rhodospirillaceae bacterium]|nr:cell division protein ZipA [Rhodospirillaceae bacterium]